MLLLLCIYITTGLLMSALAIPLIKGWINPNPLYGFRVKATLEDPAIWYAANTFAGWRLLVAGIVIAAAAVAFYLVPNQQLERFAFSCLAATVIALVWAVVSSFAYLNRLTARR
ncbi:SdpI family protein [Anatilimnocola sp. NA78]|uniref:SdpI family protein n=1 Tax=Anatilimnocola sp. NA78 TaxID=3415683 RepID=UPI003CE4ED10